MGNKESTEEIEYKNTAEIRMNAATKIRSHEINVSRDKNVEYWRLRLKGDNLENGEDEIRWRNRTENEGHIFITVYETGEFRQYEYLLFGDTILDLTAKPGESHKDVFDRDFLGIPIGTVPYTVVTQGIYGEVLYERLKGQRFKNAPNRNLFDTHDDDNYKKLAREYFTDYKGFYLKLGIKIDDTNLPEYFKKVQESMK